MGCWVFLVSWCSRGGSERRDGVVVRLRSIGVGGEDIVLLVFAVM